MSVQDVGWVLEHSVAEGTDRLVLLAIANHVADHNDGRGPVAWPSIGTLAAEARVSRATVYRSLHRLVELGELEVVHGLGRGHTNVYRIRNGRNLRPFTEAKGSQKGLIKVSPEQIKGRNRATQNHKEPEPVRARAREATDTLPIVPVELPDALPDDVRARGAEFFRTLRGGETPA